jgi:predicted negative regulator of RcsB-dependent stress response
MTENGEKFDTWAIVEAMGFKKLAGHVTEQAVGGASFIRVDVPASGDDCPAFCKLIGAGSIYMITPCDEETARSDPVIYVAKKVREQVRELRRLFASVFVSFRLLPTTNSAAFSREERSSAASASGFLNRWPGVRVTPGAFSQVRSASRQTLQSLIMTSPHRSRVASDNRLEMMADWFDLHSKQVTVAVIVIAAAVGGVWFYRRSEQLKAERAERAFYAAEQSMAAGNLPLAESDLRKMITRYDGTTASRQATLTLAQIMYDQGKHQEGVTLLKQAIPRLEASEDFASSGHLLLATGYEQLRRFTEAAAEYQAAATKARFDQDRQRYQSLAANAYLLGGRKDEAKRIWTALAADSKGTVAGEARVRLGELTAVPATALQPKT